MLEMIMTFVRAQMAEIRREEGQALVEYALILSLVSVAAILALTDLGGAISGLFEDIVGQL